MSTLFHLADPFIRTHSPVHTSLWQNLSLLCALLVLLFVPLFLFGVVKRNFFYVVLTFSLGMEEGRGLFFLLFFFYFFYF